MDEVTEYPKMIYPGEVDGATGVIVVDAASERAQRKEWKKAAPAEPAAEAEAPAQ